MPAPDRTTEGCRQTRPASHVARLEGRSRMLVFAESHAGGRGWQVVAGGWQTRWPTMPEGMQPSPPATHQKVAQGSHQQGERLRLAGTGRCAGGRLARCPSERQTGQATARRRGRTAERRCRSQHAPLRGWADGDMAEREGMDGAGNVAETGVPERDDWFVRSGAGTSLAGAVGVAGTRLWKAG